MKLTSPSYIKFLCEKYNFRPSKSYGQNYLIHDAPIKKIIEVAEIKKHDVIVEVGPGFGVLTFVLAEHAKQVIAFEIERKLEEYWEEKLKDWEIKRVQQKTGQIKIIWGDVLKNFPVAFGLGAHALVPHTQPYKLIANLPYQITSHVLRTFLEAENKPTHIVVMVQKEVAHRIIAKPNDMSLLAVSVQYYGAPRIVTKVSKGNFWPAPKVDSAVLAIHLHSEQPSQEVATDFFRVVRAGFQNKRKQLWRNISVVLDKDGDAVKQILKEIVRNEKVRAQELTVEEWKKVQNKLGKL